MAGIKVEIWSDVVCPFCYIGKRRLEAALHQFGSEKVEIEFKSFQLDPDMNLHAGKDVYDYLAERYGKDREWSVGMHRNVAEQARMVGLDYRFDEAVPAPTFDAHRAAHFAKSKGFGNAYEELLFRAYFTEGKNIADHQVLIALGESLGMKGDEILAALEAGYFEEEVRSDIAEAGQIGVQGVPFFLFNRKYAVSGAQDPAVFLEVLKKASAQG